jgi:hypothetical protein
MQSDDPRIRLVNHLGGLANYNDKGFLWSRHDADQVRDHQRQAQQALDKLVDEIGEEAFSADLLQKLRSGAAATDASGDIEEQARAELMRPSPGEESS